VVTEPVLETEPELDAEPVLDIDPTLGEPVLDACALVDVAPDLPEVACDVVDPERLGAPSAPASTPDPPAPFDPEQLASTPAATTSVTTVVARFIC